jgi:hypothetical protein
MGDILRRRPSLAVSHIGSRTVSNRPAANVETNAEGLPPGRASLTFGGCTTRLWLRLAKSIARVPSPPGENLSPAWTASDTGIPDFRTRFAALFYRICAAPGVNELAASPGFRYRVSPTIVRGCRFFARDTCKTIVAGCPIRGSRHPSLPGKISMRRRPAGRKPTGTA